ncbi:fluoride efflux transporter CrcB [Cohnella sp. 56]|uniref:fluoride efflux transporter CrcB n=1 Tax=Cohnella sp. 56 TaxID=3113722 RepID=UPI0030E7D20D
MIGHVGWVAIGGFFGACARYGFGVWGKARFRTALPLATMLINLSGSFLLGMLAGGDWGSVVSLLFGTGFMGAYTTFSTFNVENINLIRNKAWRVLLLYVAGSYVLGIALAWCGYELGLRM